jgi:methionine-rich copper-binding protein CopC
MRMGRWSPGAVALTALVIVGTTSALGPTRHLYLEAESPRADTTLVASPPAIMLWFSQEPLPNTTEIKLLDASGAVQPVSAVRGDAEDPFHFRADVLGTLPPGKYQVRWLTWSDDEPGGFLRDGSFTFSVKAP